jgi:alpha-L-rhamnosidase
MPFAVAPSAPRFEHRTDRGPVLGIATVTPRLSWTVADADPGYVQRAYEVEITRAGRAELHAVESAEQVLVDWPAPPLRSREAASVRVRVRDETWSAWSDAAVVEAGLLHAAEWRARFVSPVDLGGLDQPAPLISGTLDVAGTVASARLHATAHGVYSPMLNGVPVGDEVLAPGWTAYDSRLRTQVYDVTDLVRTGRNDLDVLLGNGWYRGHLAFNGRRAIYGDRLALLAQLEVTTTTGETHVLATDASWTARESGILADDLYDGQVTDLRRQHDGTHSTNPRVEVVEGDLSGLVAADGPPIRRTESIPATAVWQSPNGRTLVDFGQNLVGWVRLRVGDLPPGTEVTVRHAEVLENDELGTRPLRAAKATDTWFVAGDPEERLEPCFTFHGFRYAEVSGVPGLTTEDLEAVVVGSDLPRTGWFASSDPLLDRFHENVVWGMRGNFLDVPTDCPQRDERLGWTGDIQVFAPTATFLFDTAGFLSSWLADLAVEQLPDGTVPHIVPYVSTSEPMTTPAAAWGDAATIVPWVLYERTGDRGILARQFPSMRAWVDKVAEVAGSDRIWAGGFQYGDWLDPTAPPEDPYRAKADPDVVATAHFARSASLVAAAAGVLGLQDEAERYAELADEVRTAFIRRFVSAEGRITSDAATVYALAIEWSLLSGAWHREAAGRRLAELVEASGCRISTGFVGTPLVCDALTSIGRADLAHRLLMQTECPSWLYAVTMGATTVWERWDSMLPDGSINGSEMTSFNHYALGAVADWMHRSVAGLAPGDAGYRQIVVRPQPPEGLAFAEARHLTPYGEAEVAWRRSGDRFRLDANVPVGATALVTLPGWTEPEHVGHGRHTWEIQLNPASRMIQRDAPTAVVADV